MAQQIIPAAQLVHKFQGIERFNNYVVLSIHAHRIQDSGFSYISVFKEDVIEYPRFTKLIIADLIKKYPSIPLRLEEDYHSIKDDIPLVSVYTTGNVTVRGMLILDAFLTEEICATDDYKETTPRPYRTPTLSTASPQGKKRKQCARETSSPSKSLKITIKQKQVVEGDKVEESYADKFDASKLHDDVNDSGDRIEPESHKEHLEVIDDDDENKGEKKYEKKDDEMGSLENMTEKMQAPIPTTPRSPRINLSSDKNITQELTDTVLLSSATTSKDPHKKRHISSMYSHLTGALCMMCRRQGYMIRDMERKCVTTDKFWNVHGKVDQVLYEIVPQIVERATNDLIEDNLKRAVADTVIQERDAFLSKTNVIQVHPTSTTSTDITSSANLQQQLYLKMKSNLQDQANDPALWDVLKHKFEKSSTSNSSCRDDDFHSQHHDDPQDDDAHPEGEKRVKRHKTSKMYG
ncbi:hypothetical protein Tco_0537723 [Tanacetum coccineum]